MISMYFASPQLLRTVSRRYRPVACVFSMNFWWSRVCAKDGVAITVNPPSSRSEISTFTSLAPRPGFSTWAVSKARLVIALFSAISKTKTLGVKSPDLVAQPVLGNSSSRDSGDQLPLSE